MPSGASSSPRESPPALQSAEALHSQATRYANSAMDRAGVFDFRNVSPYKELVRKYNFGQNVRKYRSKEEQTPRRTIYDVRQRD
jgi:hypothetical protein